MSAVVVLGGGAVARAFATDLAALGRPVRIWARRPEAARAIASTDGVEAFSQLGEALESARTVLLCVSDRALEVVAHTVANELSARSANRPVEGGEPRVALHTSGWHGGREVLAALEAAGFALGSLHPLLPITRGGEGAPAPRSLRGAWFAVEGDEAARERAEELVADLRGQALRLGHGDASKHAYHAAAALLSGGAVALFDLALEQLDRTESDEPERVLRRAFAALLRATADNLEAAPAKDALTGPIVRGDAAVVAGHLRVLEASGGEGATRIYRALGERLLALAEQRGLAAADVERLRRALR